MADDLGSWLNPDPQRPRPQEVELQQLQLTLQRAVSQRAGVGLLIGDMKVLRDPDMSPASFAVEIGAFVLAEQLPPARVEDVQRIEVQVPDGWWETFRHEYRGRWWMRRWVARRPVRLRSEVRVARLTVDLRRYWTFPRSQITLPELGKPVRVVQWEQRTTVGPQ